MFEAKPAISQPLALDLSRSDRPWRTRLADWVSIVFSPPIITSLGIWFAGSQIATPAAWNWALREWMLVVVIPALFVVWLLVRGRISDLDVSIRQQRMQPYRLTAVCALLAFVLALLDPTPQPLVLFSGAAAAQIVLLYVVTTRWKISLHSASMASCGVVMLAFDVSQGLPFLAGIPLLAWARVHLKRHTLAQTVAGTLAGGWIYGLALLAIH